MNGISAAAIFFVLWWLVFFAVLPFGARSQVDAGDVTLGTEHGAPAQIRLWRKAGITTAITVALTALFYLIFQVWGLSLEDLII